MELSDLLELLYSAYGRFTSIQLSWHYYYNIEKMNFIQQRWINMNPPGSVSMLVTQSNLQKQQSKFVDIYKQLWWQKPNLWRDEYQIGTGKKITRIISNGHTNPKGISSDFDDYLNDAQLIDPSFLLTTHKLQILGNDNHAGRDAIKVRAIYHKGKDRIYEPFFWATADEYELLIDQHRGILLRYAAKLDGEEFAVSSVSDVIYDAPIVDEVFNLDR